MFNKFQPLLLLATFILLLGFFTGNLWQSVFLILFFGIGIFVQVKIDRKRWKDYSICPTCKGLGKVKS